MDLRDIDTSKPVSVPTMSVTKPEPEPEPETDTKRSVTISPSSATIELEGTRILSLNALLNNLPVDQQKYAIQWYLGDPAGKPISMGNSLTGPPFIEAIGNKEGTYKVSVMVIDKATSKEVGRAYATVIAKKSLDGPLSGTWKGTFKGRSVSEIFWTETTDVQGTITISVRQRGSDVVGAIFMTDYKASCVSSDPEFPCTPMPLSPGAPIMERPVDMPEGSLYWLNGKIDSNGSLNITYLDLPTCVYHPESTSYEDIDISVSISGNSMILNSFTYRHPSPSMVVTGTASFTVTKVSEKYYDKLFQ